MVHGFYKPRNLPGNRTQVKILRFHFGISAQVMQFASSLADETIFLRNVGVLVSEYCSKAKF